MKAFCLYGAGALLLAANLTAMADATPPKGWIVAGSNPRAYDCGTDLTVAAPGSQHSATIKAKSADASGFATLMQIVAADNYRGQRIRLSALLRTGSASRAQLWMRVDGADHEILAFDNMDSRPIVGTTDWQSYSVVLNVPKDSADIAFGFLLSGQGAVWADQFQLEAVGNDVAPTATSPAALPKVPVDLDFAQ
jgi:hypothetical protein